MPKLPLLLSFPLLFFASFAYADEDFVTCYSVLKFINANDGSRYVSQLTLLKLFALILETR